MEIGEFELIGRIRSMFPAPPGVTGIGDDCAILPQRDGLQTLVTTDMLVEGVHFLREDAHPYDLGWKSAAVNISDIAGMGGKPAASFLSIALPKDLPSSWILEFMEGYRDLSSRFNCPLLGGDTCSSPDRISVNVAVLGTCESGRARKRSDAGPGDLVCTGGPVGDSAAGLRILLSTPESGRSALERLLVRRHYRPVPKVDEGLLLSSLDGVHAMMDISDGIGSDLRHITDASRTGAVIDTLSLPLSDELRQICALKGWDPVELALDGGEDYELLFTIDPAWESEIRSALCAQGCRLNVIGKVTGSSDGIVWKGSGRDYNGYRHF